jgi:putative membrane protein
MTKHLCFAAAALLLLPSCSNQATAPEDKIEVTGQSAQPPAGPAPQEVQGQAFASSVLGSLDFSLASARFASERSDGANTRALAQKMSADFGAARQELAGLIQVEPASAATHESDLAILSSTRGAPLERAFAEQQMDALTLLIGTVRAYKNGGDNPALKAWAEKYQGAINDRLLDVQTLRAELEGEG